MTIDKKVSLRRSPGRLGLSLMCVLLGLALTACSAKSQNEVKSEYKDPGTAADTSYQTTTVTRGDFQLTFQIDSKMDYTSGRQLYWPHEGDRFDTMKVKQGDFVKAGDVLATFTVDVSQADLLEKQLAVSQAQEDRDQTNIDYTRSISDARTAMAGLTGSDYAAAQDRLNALYAQQQQALAKADYQIDQASQALKELTDRRQKTELTAPFDGYVGYTSDEFRQGDYVPVSEPIIGLADTSRKAISFTNTNPYADVPYKSTVTLQDQKTQKTYTGTVISCRQVTGSDQDDVIVMPQEDLPDGALAGAVRVTGTLLEKKNVLLVEASAIGTEGSRSFVTIVNDDGSTRKAYVSVGAKSGQTAWITEGLEEGQTVLLNQGS